MVRDSWSSWVWPDLPNPKEPGGRRNVQVPWGLLWNKIIPEHVCHSGEERGWNAILGARLASDVRAARRSFRTNVNSSKVQSVVDMMCSRIEEQARKGLALPCVLLYRRNEKGPPQSMGRARRNWDILTPKGARVVIGPAMLATAYAPGLDITGGPTAEDEWPARVAQHLLHTFGVARDDPNHVVRVKGGKSTAWHRRVEFVRDDTWERVAREGASAFDPDRDRGLDVGDQAGRGSPPEKA